MNTRDFGDVFDGEELEQNFPVANIGTKPLELRQKSSLAGALPAAAAWNSANSYVARPAAAVRAAPS